MRICVAGPPRSGKTTLARLLARIMGSRIPLISGDHYINEVDSDPEASLERLREDLHVQSAFIFEHVSSANLLHRFDIKADLAIFLRPESEVLIKRGLSADYFSSTSFAHQEKQYLATCATGIATIDGRDVSAALCAALDHLATSGHFPPPIHTVIIKVASQCNLNCTYCYMYKGHDHSWRSAPFSMSTKTASAVGRRIREYCELTQRDFSVVLHGGEPLTIPLKDFEAIVTNIQNEICDLSNITCGVQTNGTLLTNEYLDCIDRLGLAIGVSLDGGPDANRDRINHAGRQSTDVAEKAIRMCLDREFIKGQFGGVLSVVNPAASGKDVYTYFRDLGVRAVDFLLRDMGPNGLPERSSEFLSAAFAEWLKDDKPMTVRFFKSVVAQLLHVNWSTDAIGLAPINLLGVSTSGDWELLDLLRTSHSGAWQTPYNVFAHSIKDVHDSASYKRLLNWQYDFADACVGCKHLLVCGGGYLPSRFDGNSFKNPSRHCDDLYEFIEIVAKALEVETKQLQP